MGGSRHGAGRKPGPGRPLQGERRRIRVSFTLDPRSADWLRAAAADEGTSMSQTLDRAIADAGRFQGGAPRRTGLPRSRLPFPVPERKLARFCARHAIRRLALFGSVLTNRFGPDSDVAVLV